MSVSDKEDGYEYYKDKCCANSLKPQYGQMLRAVGASGTDARILSHGKDCGIFVKAVIKYTGVDPGFTDRNTTSINKYLKNEADKSNGKWISIKNNKSTRNLKPGDIFVWPRSSEGYGHVYIYVG